MKKQKNFSSVSDLVTNIVKPIIESLNLQLWDVRFVKEGANWYLRVFIDNDKGISIDDCEKVSRLIEEPIDKLNPIKHFYYLEVCSPGIERELIKPEHFKKFLNYNVKIRLFGRDINNRKEIIGKLLDFDDNNIYIQENDNIKSEIIRKNIAHINLCDMDL